MGGGQGPKDASTKFVSASKLGDLQLSFASQSINEPVGRGGVARYDNAVVRVDGLGVRVVARRGFWVRLERVRWVNWCCIVKGA